MWKLQTLQALWFTSDLSGADAQTLFNVAFDREPDSTQKNRMMGPGVPFLSQASGEHNGLVTVVTVQLGRIAIALTPAQHEIDINEPFLSIDQAAAWGLYRSAVEKASERLSGVVRTATVATFSCVVKSYEEAAGIIFYNLHATFPTDGLSDVEVQINRRMEAPDGTKVNRVLKMNVLGIEVVIGDERGRQVGPSGQPLNMNAAHLSLDINNVPDRGVLDVHAQKRLFDLYLSEAERLSSSNSPVLGLWNQ